MSKDLENQNEELESKVTAEEPVAEEPVAEATAVEEAATEEVAEEAAVEEAVAEEAAEEVEAEEVNEPVQEADMTAEEFAAQEAKANPVKKEKKKFWKDWTKKKKIIFSVVSGVLAVILIAIIAVVAWLFGQEAKGQDTDMGGLEDWTPANYVVGTVNPDIDLEKMFPNGDNFKLTNKAGSSCSISGKTLKVQGSGEFTLKYKDTELKKDIELAGKIVAGAVNADTWKEIRDAAADKKVVALQSALIKTEDTAADRKLQELNKDYAALFIQNDFYGNGGTLNLHTIVASRDGNKIKKEGFGKTGGDTGIWVMNKTDGSQVLVQDLKVTGNDMQKDGDIEGLTDKVIKKRGVLLYSNYGDLIRVRGFENQRANAKLYHCVFENAHKVVHVTGYADLVIEGSVIRNASDTTLSIATTAGMKNKVTVKNNVIASSYTTGILFYCYDGSISKDNEANTWNELTIEGFLDIYNWKEENDLAFLPETEGGSQLISNVANTIAGTEIPKEDYDALKGKVTEKDKNGKEVTKKYIHFAIMKIRTGNGAITYNNSQVKNYKDVGFSTSVENGLPNGFPVPDLATSIMKQIDVWGYYSKIDQAVTPTSKLSDNKDICKQLIEGRQAA